MGFASPAMDYIESSISLDRQLIQHPTATYFMRADATYLRAGIISGALLVVDAAAVACDGSIIVCAIAGEHVLRRLRLYPRRGVESLDNGRFENLTEDADFFGVITYIINDARSGEFVEMTA